MKKLLKRLRYFKIQDLSAPFIFMFMLMPSLIFRIVNKMKKRRLWLICEDGYTARDNGYHLFNYVRNEHPNDYCFYVIDKKSDDYDKVKNLGNIIQFKSLKHWLYYLAAEYNISNHKHGNPCQSFFFLIHVVFRLYYNRVFLQHGITINDSPWIYFKNTRFRYFICGAKKEYEYIKEKFGYPDKNVIYTGFSRFDNLYHNKANEKQILIMPTWRNWLGGNYVTDNDFLKTDYFKKWNSVLNNKNLVSFIEKENYFIYFYPHQHTQKFLHLFNTSSKNIKIVDNKEKDIQDLLKESKILITDYSSVFMDFAYMNKPVILYQFDYDEYRKKQLQQGYFDYKEDGFGPVVVEEKELVDNLISVIKNGLENKYVQKNNNFFEKKDQKNSERVYDILINN